MTRVLCCSQSDVWALGCVLYELTTLNHAFDGANMCALVLKILRGTYPPIPGEYSQELRSLIDSMLQAKPDDRPSVLDIIRTPVILSRIRQFERAEREKSRLHLDVVQDLSASRDMGGARAPGVAAAAAAAAPSTSRASEGTASSWGEPILCVSAAEAKTPSPYSSPSWYRIGSSVHLSEDGGNRSIISDVISPAETVRKMKASSANTVPVA